MTAFVEALTVSGDPDTWRSIGLVVDPDGWIPLMGTSLRVVSPAAGEPTGCISGWSISGIAEPEGAAIDGLSTVVVQPRQPAFAAHPLGVSGLDHVVVTTADLSRTSGAIADATGCELKRIREVGTMKQGFHRIGRGGLIVEVVERPETDEGPAGFWGLVINVDDIDAACELLGEDRIGSAKDAVQTGRRIATVRAEAGLGFPVALMTT